MSWLLPWLMFAHVMASIVAFGPGLAFAMYGKLAAEERGPALAFNNRARALVSRRMVTPGTIVVLVSGFLMIWVLQLPMTDPRLRWLQVAIVLYLSMIAWNLLVTVPRSRRIGELGARAAADAKAAAQRAAEGGEPPPPAPSGPPPEMAKLIHQVRRDGKAMGVVIVIMVFLMVVKPAFPL